MFEAEFWVAVAFVLFFVVLGYFGIHKKVLEALDHRSARIKAELDEARRLKDEAQKLFAEYQRKQGEAEKEAQGIIAGAQAEAERLAIFDEVTLDHAHGRAAYDAQRPGQMAERHHQHD